MKKKKVIKNKKINSKKINSKKLIVICSIILFIILVIVVICCFSNREMKSTDKKISCVNDNYSYKEFSVIVDKDNTVKKVEYISYFDDKDKESFNNNCEYVKTSYEIDASNAVDYITNKIDCNEKTLRVTSNKIYKVDGDNSRSYAYQVKKFTNENAILDLNSFKAYMEKIGYKCNY